MEILLEQLYLLQERPKVISLQLTSLLTNSDLLVLVNISKERLKNLYYSFTSVKSDNPVFGLRVDGTVLEVVLHKFYLFLYRHKHQLVTLPTPLLRCAGLARGTVHRI
jgi:hypothetical protein